MSERRYEGDAVTGALPGSIAGALPPDVIRCSVCGRPLLRARRTPVRRSMVMQCPHCKALQHRHL